MTYFTSDLHFGHANIMKFHPNFRKFQNINDMDNTLIRLWNSRVNPCDEVYNLGDVSFHKDFEQTLKILKRLNGKHVLILGNHDQEIRKRTDELLMIRKNDNNALFEEICDYKELALKHGGESFRLALFHYPVCEWNGGHHSEDKGQGAKRRLRPARQNFRIRRNFGLRKGFAALLARRQSIRRKRG